MSQCGLKQESLPFSAKWDLKHANHATFTTVSALPLYLWDLVFRGMYGPCNNHDSVCKSLNRVPTSCAQNTKQPTYLRHLGRQPRLESPAPDLCLLHEDIFILSSSNITPPSPVWQRLQIRCPLASIMRVECPEKNQLFTNTEDDAPAASTVEESVRFRLIEKIRSCIFNMHMCSSSQTCWNDRRVETRLSMYWLLHPVKGGHEQVS